MRLAALLLLASLCGCASISPSATVPSGEARLYVVGRGWHTDIGLAVDEVSGPLASLENGFPGVRYMVFGFGEREYYMARKTGSAEMIAALFPSKSAILLTALNAPPDVAFADQRVVMLHLPQTGVDEIADGIWQALEKQDGAAVRLADGPYVGSMFYASRETYDLFYTCNTWTARLLRDAGFPMNTNVVFADQIMRQVSGIAERQAR